MWWLRRSISTTSASACRSACAAAIPAKPPPMITTRFCCLAAGSGGDTCCRERVSSRATVILVTLLQGRSGRLEARRRAFLSAGAGHCAGCRMLFLGLGAQFEQPEQDLVALRRQITDGARAHLGVNTVDELLLDLRRQDRRAKGLPPRRHRTAELRKEVLDAPGAATEMIEHHVAHDAPAQARPPGQGGVDVGSADDTLGNEVINLARQRSLQAVGDVARHFLVEAHRPLPDRRI